MYNELRMDWGGLILLVLSALFVKKICLKAEREREREREREMVSSIYFKATQTSNPFK